MQDFSYECHRQQHTCFFSVFARAFLRENFSDARINCLNIYRFKFMMKHFIKYMFHRFLILRDISYERD